MKKQEFYVKVIIKGFHPYYINRFVVLSRRYIEMFRYTNIEYNQQIFLPQVKEKFTILRSPHVDKKARDQFERITHKRILFFKVLENDKIKNSLTIFRFLNILSNFAVGVSIDITYKKK